jgi:hypothetical protein
MWVNPTPRRGVSKRVFLAACAAVSGFGVETWQNRYPECEFGFTAPAHRMQGIRQEVENALSALTKTIRYRYAER